MDTQIKNIDDVKSIINKYQWLKNKAVNFVDINNHYDEITNLEIEGDDVIIYYSTYDSGETDYYSKVVPISWFFLNDDELKKAKKEKEEAEKLAEQKLKEKNKLYEKQEQERKEREEYERLKAKFG